MTFPNNFKSENEYIGYLKCLDDAMPGDIAYIYIDNYGCLTHKASKSTREVLIIGKQKSYGGYCPDKYKILLGSNDPYLNFWKISTYSTDQFIKENKLTNSVMDISKFKYAYWAFANAIKIAKIIKTKSKYLEIK